MEPTPGDDPRPAPGSRPGSRRLVIGAVLVVLGALAWALAVWRDHGERHSYSPEPLAPPAYVHLTAGHTYTVSTLGGYEALTKRMQPSMLKCTMQLRGGAAVTLPFQAETDDKGTHRIGSFVAPESGRAHVSCLGSGPVYVDDADGAVDYAGAIRLLAVVLLTVGVPLTLSGFAERGRPSAGAPAEPA